MKYIRCGQGSNAIQNPFMVRRWQTDYFTNARIDENLLKKLWQSRRISGNLGS